MGNKLYIGNLSYQAGPADLEEIFAQVGSVASVSVVTDKATGQSRGFAFVEMSSDDEAQAAIERLDGQEVCGRAIKVNEARPRTDERRPRGDYGDRGDRGGGGERRRW